jgi:dTDP-4-dehydrorhamnose reductase
MKTRQKMLVTGASGMVGAYVTGVFSDWDVALTNLSGDHVHLDIRDPKSVRFSVESLRPDVVLHLAAATDVDRCEQDPEWAFHVNAIGTQNVALACQAFSIPLVYISTAAVFPGDKPEPYNEFDFPKPANVYGHSKLEGEHLVSGSCPRYYIVRSGWMIGGGAQKDKKFVGKIARLIAEGRRELQAVDDKIGSPTYAKDFLEGIKALIATNHYGLYHLVNRGSASRYQIALLVRAALGATDVSIVPVSSASFPLPAPRGHSESLRNLKLELLGLDRMRKWEDALTDYVTSELLPSLNLDSRTRTPE